tara:strand:+ start:511 stop:651 length:141 start_codon:yes stop_codon:yes gene_type:complete
MFVVNSKFRNKEIENLIEINKNNKNAETFLKTFTLLFRKQNANTGR